MRVLEALPVELFGEIASYLSFWDKALSVTSKRCHTIIGHFECPDQLTWLIHQYRDQAKFHDPLYGNPQVLRILISSIYSHLVYKYGRMVPLKIDIQELMSPYFPNSFPECTLTHSLCEIGYPDLGRCGLGCRPTDA